MTKFGELHPNEKLILLSEKHQQSKQEYPPQSLEGISGWD